jgi:hypothetical protein
MSGRARPVAAAVLLALAVSPASAQNEPITSPQDARCRDEARDHVFTAPNPNGLSPYALGAELYHACMKRLGAEQGGETPRRR